MRIELAGVKSFESEFEVNTQQFEKRRIYYQTLVQRGNWVQKELAELAHKKIVVHDKKNPSCPLCEQVLTLKRKQFLAKTFVAQEKMLQHRIGRISDVLKRLKQILFEQHSHLQKMNFRSDCYKQLQANEETYRRSLQELETEHKKELVAFDLLQVRLLKEQADCEVLQKALEEKKKEQKNFLDKDTVLVKARNELLALEKEKEKIKYDKKIHDELLKSVDEYEKKMQQFRDLQLQNARQQERFKIITSLSAELKRFNRQRVALNAQQGKMHFDPVQLQELEEKINEEKQRQGDFLSKKEKAFQKKGSLESWMTRFSSLRKEKEERKKIIEEIGQQVKEYQVLAQMFGKDGIQALLIEQAIPEIECEANYLLSRLTDNKSQIFIESLRDLKKGGVKESLDIHISDASGIRPYELFSGGEAFRIDFALRIAISKLLARRAGTALQTLIIDEGFGSQDEEGLQRLMDAIYAIQKDFVKIIIVSHLSAFKNNFPVHFVVEKDSLGSFIQIEERG